MTRGNILQILNVRSGQLSAPRFLKIKLLALLISAAAVVLTLPVRATDISWTNANGGNWSSVTNWSPNQIPGPNDQAFITNAGNYTVILDVSASVVSLTIGSASDSQVFSMASPNLTISSNITVLQSGGFIMSGGTVQGAGTVSLSGTNTWNGGQFNNAGGITVNAFGTLFIASGADHDMPGQVLNNLGTVIRTGGRLRTGSASMINNSGLWLDEEDNVISHEFGGDTAMFVNTGTFVKTNSTGTTTIQGGCFLINHGLVIAESGLIEVSDGGGTNDGTFLAATNAVCDFNSTYTMLDGSRFQGAGAVSLNGSIIFTGSFSSQNLYWSSGFISGTPTNASGSIFFINTGNDHNMPSTTLVNLGTVNHTGGRIRHGSGSMIQNQNLWLDVASADFNEDYGGVESSFVNAFGGTFRKTDSNTTIFQNGIGLVNHGLVDIQAGQLQMNDGSGQNDGTFNVATNANCNFSSTYVMGNGSTFTGQGATTLNGVINFVGTINSQNLQWVSGSISGTLTNPSSSTFFIVSANDHNMPGAILDNLGMVVHTAGRIRHGSGSAIINESLWSEQTEYDFNNDYGGTSSQFLNIASGVFRKTVDTNNTIFQGGISLFNHGLVDIQTGTLTLNDGGGSNNGTMNAATNAAIVFNNNFAINDGSVFSGQGVAIINGAAIFSGGFNSQNLQWSSGNISGVGTNLPGSTFYIVSGADHNVTGGNLDNRGTVIHTGGRVRFGSGSSITNENTWLDEADYDFNHDLGGQVSLFVNATNAVFQKINSTGTTTFQNAVLLVNHGLVDAESGTVTVNDGGGMNDNTFNAGSAAAVRFTSDYNFNAGTRFTGLGVNSLDQGAMIFNGSFVSSNLNWIADGAARLSGVATNLPGSTFLISSGADHDMYGAVFVNQGTVIHTGGRIRHGSGSVITNQNIWLEEANYDFNHDFGGPVSFFVNETGSVLRKVLTTGNTTFQNAICLINRGLVDAQSGEFVINDGGGTNSGTFNAGAGAACDFIAAYTMNNGSQFTGAGANLLDGTINFTGGFTSQNLQWSSGSVVGNGTNLVGGTFYITTGNDHQLIGASLNNLGTITHTGGRIRTGSGSTINNNGLWQAQCDYEFNHDFGGADAVFANNGTFSKSVTAGTTSFQSGFDFNNIGVLEILTGTVAFNDTYTETGETFRLGLSSATTAGRANFANGVSLDGTFSTSLLGGYIPQVGDTFTLLGYSSRTGTFSNLNLSPLPTNESWQVSYNAGSFVLQVAGYSNSNQQITGSVTTGGAGVSNVTVFAFTSGTNATYLTSVTDGSGNYSINVTNGNWTVGLQDLPARGYNSVANQAVTVNNSNAVVNFTVSPFTGQQWAITTAVNPVGAGAVTGAGNYVDGAIVTVTAVASTSLLPYVFSNWTEGGIIQTTNSTYVFPAVRSRDLVANFTYNSYTVTVSNNPVGAGTVSGAGTFQYGTTNILTATPVFGYAFTNWTQNGVVLGTNLTLSTIVLSNEFIVANYFPVNLSHVITTVTSPTNLTTVAGAGTYTNGDVANFSAPQFVTNAPNIYSFSQYTVSNSVASTNTIFSKTFSTLDPTNLQYVAVYTVKAILPQVTNAIANFPNPVPATTNFIVSIQFDRTMLTNPAPTVYLTNATAGIQTNIPAVGGSWTSTVFSNDTYSTPAITIDPTFNGTNAVFVSGAEDTNSSPLSLTNVATIVVQATPPPAPTVTVTAVASGSVTVSWAGYVAPADLTAFRVYLATTNFTTVTGIPVLTGFGPGTLNYQFTGLSLDTTYYALVQAVDSAGNASAVTPISISIPSVIPPPVVIQQTPVSGTSALLSWTYDTNLIGFAGFAVYYQTTSFSSAMGLTPQATLSATNKSFQVDSLDRSKTYYFAVIGFNYTNGFNPSVTTVTWTDPFAGQIAVNTTIGGTTPSVVNINQNIIIVSNAVLTVTPGTTLLFATNTGITIQSGALIANGTALSPILFDSVNDTAGHAAAPGDWNGVTLGAGAGTSSLSFVQVSYGKGLTVSGCSPLVDAFTANFNSTYGLGLQNGATLTTSNALLTANGIGMAQTDSSTLTIGNSVILNNGTNAIATGTSSLAGIGNWWGSAAQSDVAATVQGSVNYAPVLNYEPVLTPAIGGLNGVTQVSSPVANVQLACRTAVSMRLSEDSTFAGVFFQPFAQFTTFSLSAGGGVKHIFAQFKSVTGQTNSPVELDVNFVTSGPTIQSFSLIEGQTISRPILVTGSATAPLGLLDMEFYVDGVLQGTNAGGSLSFSFDVRKFSNAIHAVKLVARDNGNTIAIAQDNIIIASVPPLAPSITVPATDIITNTSLVTIGGTAEAGIAIQVTANGSSIGSATTDSNGNFTITKATLFEGVNTILAIASDSIGSTPSPARTITVSTVPPAAVVMNTPVYTPALGVTVTWKFATTGKRPTSFQLFWDTTPFTTAAAAAHHSVVVTNLTSIVSGLADGTYYFGVVGYDSVGNASPLSVLVTATIDTTPPVLGISYGLPSPVGPGPLTIVLTASEALANTPSLTLKPFGAISPILLTLTNVALNTYQSVFTVSPAMLSGAVTVNASAQDLAGNVFSGSPAGVQLVLDTTAPAGTITTVPASPVKDVSETNVSVTLTLTKPAGTGLTPALSYTPPTGPVIPLTLTGAGSNWVGALVVSPAMGTGVGQFSLSVTDLVGNVGTIILAGSQLELFDAALPPAPAAPTNIVATSLAGGFVNLTWNPLGDAQIYRLYRATGSNFVSPTLIQDNLTTPAAVDLPAVDGTYTYGVSASRFGSESGISNTVVAVSDRTAPPTPTNVNVTLASSGLQITWLEPAGDVPDHYNILRNGAVVATVKSVVPISDYPPAGSVSYSVAAVDKYGNTATSTSASISLVVGPVNNLSVVVQVGQAVALSWIDNDSTVVGYNLYRNGIKQNTTPITTNDFTDTLPLSDAVQYSVTAVNTNAVESPARLVTVYPVTVALQLNANSANSNNPPTVNYFDTLNVGLSNRSSSQTLSLTQLKLTRSGTGLDPLTISPLAATNIPAQSGIQSKVVFPEVSVPAPQAALQVIAVQQTDSQGSSVVYQDTFTLPSTVTGGSQVLVSVNQLPLAGGLTSFQLQLNNLGYADMQVIVERGFGATPGDVYISVLNNLGQEVSRTPFQGTPPGTTFLSDGTGYVTVHPGGSLAFTVPNVLTPAALAGSSNVVFVGAVSNIYNDLSLADQQVSGPISGQMISSSLMVPPYNGTATTDHPVYVNGAPIIISGQAISTANNLPVANALLNIGFFARGFKWYQQVTTDANGNYTYIYQPPPGFAGNLSIWAAHPSIVDRLNQVQVQLFQLFLTPSSGDIQMSKNGDIQFSLQMINPGDVALTGFNLAFSAYQQVGTNLQPITTVTGTNSNGTGFSIGPNSTVNLTLSLHAAINAPDNAEVHFTFISAEGAAATFIGDVTLLPAVPALTVVNPPVGYLQQSVNRGQQVSGQIAIKNTGFDTLKGIVLTPPTNTWIGISAPVSADGLIHIPDLPVGATNSITVVYNPPTNQPLAFYPDSITVTGTNSANVFSLGVYALVTSSQSGAVQFYITDNLGLPLPVTTIRMHNNLLSQDAGPFYTDTNGYCTVTNLEIGDWNWQAVAPGCSAAVGTLTILADQTIMEEAELNRSLVTITFTVVPVPFTDVYEIEVDQTFETHVPAPVLIATPPEQQFNNLTPGFSATYNATLQNQGLIQLQNVTLTAQQTSQGSLIPLITYFPVLLPGQTVNVPVTFTYFGTNGPTTQSTLSDTYSDCSPDPYNVANTIGGFLQGLLALTVACQGDAYCPINGNLVGAAAFLGAFGLTFTALSSFGAASDVAFLIGFTIGCIIGHIIPTAGGGGGNYPVPPSTGGYVIAETGCFTPETPILMADGSWKPIVDVTTNDIVRTGVEEEKKARVAALMQFDSSDVREISLETISGKKLPAVRSSEEHLFWVDGKGWTAAAALRQGDYLFNSKGWRVLVSGSKKIPGKMKVYTFKLAGDEAFYADDVQVHDLCGKNTITSVMNPSDIVNTHAMQKTSTPSKPINAEVAK